MPYARFEMYKVRLDGKGYVKKLDAAARRLFYESVAVFLSEVEIHVPTYTGMSRGSLLPLAKYINAKGVSQAVIIPISPSNDKLAISLIKRGQNIQAGAARGDFDIEIKDGRYILKFGPAVTHYKHNDVKQSDIPLKYPTPWHSFLNGQRVANEWLNANARRKIPRLRFQSVKIGVGRARKQF